MKRSSSRGFTLVELMAVTSIIGIISALAVPSFINWRRYEVVKQYKNELSSVVVAIPDEARRWGATCRMSLGIYNPIIKPVSIRCSADGSEVARLRCNQTTGCNITDIDSRLPNYPITSGGGNLVYVAGNVRDISFTPRGQLSSGVDAVYVIAGSQYLGGNPQPQCLVISRLTAEFKEGVYYGSIREPISGATPVHANIRPSDCV